jgi:hypothetical protein
MGATTRNLSEDNNKVNGEIEDNNSSARLGPLTQIP